LAFDQNKNNQTAMKKIAFLITTLALSFWVNSTLSQQGVAINTDNTPPNASAMLDVKSTEKGILIPRMTNGQIATLGGTLGFTEKGMIVFNIDDIKIEYWDGTAWKTMVTKTSSPGNSSDGTSFCSEGVTDYDGHKYKTVKIGDQCWMAENLKSTHYADGSSITGHWAYDDIEGYALTYGRLYTWAAVMNGASSSGSNPSGVQGLCPDGWHVPSDNEWKEMEMTLGMTSTQAHSTGIRGYMTACILKETDEAFLWYAVGTEPGTNSSGFTALPGGYRDSGSVFNYLTYRTYFWSTTEYSSTNAWYRVLYGGESGVGRYDEDKTYGFSARCVKDE
jgi:uncharacterized protein (TIGR02145 family)